MTADRALSAVALVLAFAVTTTPLGAQRQAPPAPGTPKPLRLPQGRDLVLPNGMKVTLVPFGSVPKATISVVIRAGAANEPKDKAGILQLAASWLSEGTATRDGAALAQAFSSLGGNLVTTVGADESSVGTDVLSEHAPDALALVAEVVQHPRFSTADFARVRSNTLRDLAIARTRARTLAQIAFAKEIYGDHPFATAMPSEDAVKAFSPDEVSGFYRTSVGGQRAHLYVVGVFDEAAVERAIRTAFGGWDKGTSPALNPAQPKSGRTLRLVDRPKAVQSTIIVGLPAPPPNSGDYTRLQVTDALLGSGFGSRITENIRERKGYTYTPRSFVDARYRSSVWYELADVTTNVTGESLKEIFFEIDRLRRETPEKEELSRIQQNVIGIFALRNSTRAGIINQLAFADLHGLGRSYITGYTERVLSVTPEDVRSTAQKYLDPTQMKIVVVGDREQVTPQLQPYQGVMP